MAESWEQKGNGSSFTERVKPGRKKVPATSWQGKRMLNASNSKIGFCHQLDFGSWYGFFHQEVSNSQELVSGAWEFQNESARVAPVLIDFPSFKSECVPAARVAEKGRCLHWCQEKRGAGEDEEAPLFYWIEYWSGGQGLSFWELYHF